MLKICFVQRVDEDGVTWSRLTKLPFVQCFAIHIRQLTSNTLCTSDVHTVL